MYNILPPTTPPEPFAPIPLFAVILIVIVMGIPIVYYLISYKKSRND